MLVPYEPVLMSFLSCKALFITLCTNCAFTPDECCFHFVNGRLRKINVANYRRTMLQLLKIMTWVQNVTAFVDQRK
uniref:Secreted protein n=1 Tax=Periophthalmus magnuspinnatus TaxID=409849 RepID=A0A3B3ZZ16_9GOBI